MLNCCAQRWLQFPHAKIIIRSGAPPIPILYVYRAQYCTYSTHHQCSAHLNKPAAVVIAMKLFSSGDLAMLTAAGAASCSYVVTQILLRRGFGPYWLNVCKGVLMSAELGAWYLCRQKAEAKGNVVTVTDSVEMHVWGFLTGFTNAAACAFSYMSLNMMDAGKASFIFSLYIILTPLIESCIPGMQTPLTCRKVCAVLCVMVGLSLLSGCGWNCFEVLDNDDGATAGTFVALVAAVLWAANVISTKFASRYMSSQELTLYYTVVALFCSALFMYFTDDLWLPIELIKENYIILLGASLINCSHYVLFSIGVKQMSAGRVAVFLSTDTVGTAILGALVLDQLMSSLEIFGCFLILMACAVVALEQTDNGIKIDSTNHASNASAAVVVV